MILRRHVSPTAIRKRKRLKILSSFIFEIPRFIGKTINRKCLVQWESKLNFTKKICYIHFQKYRRNIIKPTERKCSVWLNIYIYIFFFYLYIYIFTYTTNIQASSTCKPAKRNSQRRTCPLDTIALSTDQKHPNKKVYGTNRILLVASHPLNMCRASRAPFFAHAGRLSGQKRKTMARLAAARIARDYTASRRRITHMTGQI